MSCSSSCSLSHICLSGINKEHPLRGLSSAPVPWTRNLLDFSSLNKIRGDSRFRGHWWPRMPSQGGMVTSTPKELRKDLLAASRQHFRGKATHQLLHSYNHSIRAVIFITIITLTSSFYKCPFLQKFLLMFLSGLVFSWEVAGGKK